MHRCKIFASLAAGALTALAVAACTSSPDTYTATRAAQGAQQPEGGGTPMSESAACQALVNAENQARTRLSCGEASHAACPDYIRPAGGEACLQYDQQSVDQCVQAIDAYTSCDDFAVHPCFITAIAGSAPQGCATPPDAASDAPGDSRSEDAGADALPIDGSAG